MLAWLLDVNQGLGDRDTDAALPNICLAEAWDDLVGPTPSCRCQPTRPARCRHHWGVVSGTLILSTPGQSSQRRARAAVLL
jgi:hypothetical protein